MRESHASTPDLKARGHDDNGKARGYDDNGKVEGDDDIGKARGHDDKVEGHDGKRMPGPRSQIHAVLVGHARAPRASPHCSRRNACRVKSSSFIGTLYCRLSKVRIVRLLRRRSAISSTRAVQMPWMFSNFEYVSRRTSASLM